MDVLKDIVQHPLFGITSFAASVLLAYIFYRRGRRDKKPLWSIKNNNLIRGFSKQLPNLDVKYSGQNVENLSIAKIVFWNAGSETIRGEDIADADPVSIVPLNNTKLLDVKLLEDNSKPSRFLISTKPDMTAAFLQFDFVDKNQGAVVQAIHTGTSAKDVTLTGTIKGAGAPEHNVLNTLFLHTLQELAPVIAALGVVGGGLYVQTTFSIGQWLLHVSLFSGMMTMAYLMFKLSRLKLERIPKQLRSHFSEWR